VSHSPVRVREPAVAGRFYPGRSRALAHSVDRLLADAAGRTAGVDSEAVPKAIVVPHAGYEYSGPIAASAYARLAAARSTVRRVVLLGPAHRVALDGFAVPNADLLRTPLGDVPVDVQARAVVTALPGVVIDDAPHAGEHSLEVHLPFLQRGFDEFAVLPLAVGVATPEAVATVLEAVWGGPETLIVVSSDLSHYETHDAAIAHDIRTVDAILDGRIDAIGPRDACGRFPLRGLLLAAARHGLRHELLDRRTSGDTAGTRDRVVGYTAIAFTEDPA
jgi:AmmeMemoRadiSam system protein B